VTQRHKELILEWKTKETMEILKASKGASLKTFPMKEGVTQSGERGDTGENNNGQQAWG